MSIELRPLGIACNLSCHYCYQNPQRDAGNHKMSYDLAKIKAEAERLGGAFTLFGGEPLLLPFDDLEELFAWGLEKFGGSSIQTNGVLIDDRHIEAFRRYQVSVGISIDGPDELNDARWRGNLSKTRQATRQVEAVIERLCREHRPPGLIVTLHQGNATADKLPRMQEWCRQLYALGIKSLRLHLLEVDHDTVRHHLALSARQNIAAILAFEEVQQTLPGMKLDLLKDMERLLGGDDRNVGCIWRACDPYTTAAVRGIEGNGQSSNCGRTNKEGVGFIKADTPGFERYLALYHTPQAQQGCAGCRFFLMCKGQCPGTAIDGDWRNRTEHCEEWRQLFTMLERRMIIAGDYPLTVQPVRLALERFYVAAWQQGRNPPLHNSLARILKNPTLEPGLPTANKGSVSPRPGQRRPSLQHRICWVSDVAREKWQPRLRRLHCMIEDMCIHTARAAEGRCAVRLVPESGIKRMSRLANTHGLAQAVLPAASLPSGVIGAALEPKRKVFLTGDADYVAQAESAWYSGALSAFHALLTLPTCCLQHGATTTQPQMMVMPGDTLTLPATCIAHGILAPLGLAPLPLLPCGITCVAAAQWTEAWLALALQRGFAKEVGWLRESFAWAVSYSELHGVAELKTPLFKLCYGTATDLGPRNVLKIAAAECEHGAKGLSFPYAQPRVKARTIPLVGVL